MKPSLILLLLCLLIFACNSSKKQQVNVQTQFSISKADSTNKEYLDWDSVKLNNIIPMVSNYKAALVTLGKPDSTITPDYSNISASFGEEKFKYCYFKGIQFEKYNDSLAFRSIDFTKSPGCFLSYKKIKLDDKTKIDDFAKTFPNSVKNKDLHGTNMDKNQWIRVEASSDSSETAWIFLFDRNNGKLIGVDYWIDD